ncbi:hypothetical protein EYF80_047079 [Liparis tanakae]|uniref:Uncharacterized protein n=1 Tax=Liparis tanakae TaxID=230148 RepID=A0A4Z2FNL0_9TELE|nr:hypothetical protein EYF80_047079 [Liparis tanakae]
MFTAAAATRYNGGYKASSSVFVFSYFRFKVAVTNVDFPPFPVSLQKAVVVPTEDPRLKLEKHGREMRLHEANEQMWRA